MFEFTVYILPFILAMATFSVILGGVFTLISDIREEKARNERYAEQMKKDAEFIPFWLK